MVSSYPMVSPMVPFKLMTPYSYPMGHNNHSLVTKNGKKIVKINVFSNAFLYNLLLYRQTCSMGQLVVSNYPMISHMVSCRLVILHSYPMGHHNYSFAIKNG